IFFLSRFGRPEIAVAACTVLSSALGLWAWRSAGHTWWRHAAAGHAAGLAFLMHQYGALAVGALGASYLLRGPRSWQRTLRNATLAGAGALGALLPWLVWVGSDRREFAA